jgi:REP element-mobilizing transposase RayT
MELRSRKRETLSMQKPIVIAHHLIWTAYGYWLPNDPRGSMSQSIASDVIADLGTLHFGRKKVQPLARDVRAFRDRARNVLKYPLLHFKITDFSTIAEGLGDAIRQQSYTCYACAIMPDHVHILLRKHKHHAEEMLENLQESSRLRLRNAGVRSSDHPIWGGSGWKVFLDTPAAIRRTIGYIEENPISWKLPQQGWPFVTEYDDWPLHPGHNPNSPYAQRLREYEE